MRGTCRSGSNFEFVNSAIGNFEVFFVPEQLISFGADTARLVK